ncbi:transcriptional regulator, LacI family [Actinacidiphila yanglinensis]|uniref:Transcriptional regulator, LacI family n=1 Tax=Actinacidiphila yanglinensis TaxID=310779 RepID=A0A1H6DHI3_9ACTN|nr:transcriptional regulator, LacI family [Actinacidiphila yanglinensis]
MQHVTQRRKRVTQAEVARLAGVSQAMVSLVLNDSDGVRVAPETRKRVEEALRQTGYTVDIMGRRLRGKSNRILGVFTYEAVFPSGTADFYGPFLGGIEEESEAQGFDLLLFTSPGRRQGRRKVYEKGSNRLGIADGCILLGRHTDRDELDRLVDERFPFVFIGRRESSAGPVSYVGGDYAAATAALHERLWSLGHRRVALVGYREESESTADRRDGYLRACRRHRKTPLALTDVDPSAVFERLRADRVTAALVETTEMAVALHALAMNSGLRVPEDLSIGVLGDTDPTQTSSWPLRATPEIDWTTFRIPRREMGSRAVRILVGMLRGDIEPGRRSQVLLPCELVDGSTVAEAPRTTAR